MKKNIYLILSLLLYLSTTAQTQKTLHAMTFNIRLSISEKDSLDNWGNRKEKVASQIVFHETDIVGVQEARPNQMADLQKLLPSYQYAGVAREPNEWGEFSAIFYNTKRLQLLAQNTFWLSENTTHVGEKGWDAACPRIVTYAQFKDKKTKKTFYVFNTHFDHIGKIARRESAKLLLQKVNEIGKNTPTIIMGDFNAKPTDEPIQIITDKNNPCTSSTAKKFATLRITDQRVHSMGFNQKKKAMTLLIISSSKIISKYSNTLPYPNRGTDTFPVTISQYWCGWKLESKK